MAIQLGTTYRNALLDQFETSAGTSPRLWIFTGAQPANCAAADPAGTLVNMLLPSDWMAVASAGSKVMAGSWTTTATGAGTAASFRIKDSASACHMQGTVGQGSGDLSLDNTNIASAQTVTVTAFSLTAPGV